MNMSGVTINDHRLHGSLAFGDMLAETARVIPVERFSNRLKTGSLLGKADYHARPRHYLKKCPVQAWRTGQSQGSQDFGQSR